MAQDEKQDLKTFAEETLLKSNEEVSSDKEIIEKLKGIVIIIKETSKVEVKSEDTRPLIRIPLYLIGKFVGFKILGIFDNSSASLNELSENLNLPVKALSRPIGILLGDNIERTNNEGYRIRAYKILDFLNSLDIKGNESNGQIPNVGIRKKSSRKEKPTTNNKFLLNKDGLIDLSKFLEISESDLRKIIFFR
ncbi:MAG: hypothetical protein AABX66_02840, partial [Nanoarchaeota archaeon]